jgi:hypothetical protein
MKQTAIEFLISKIESNSNPSLTQEELKESIEQAKETEKQQLSDFIAEVRENIANYMLSEGCSCCQDREKHEENKKKLAKLLDVPPYDDNSGYNFFQFKTQ